MKKYITIISDSTPNYHLLDSTFDQRYKNVTLPIIAIDDIMVTTIDRYVFARSEEGVEFQFADESPMPFLRKLRHSPIVEHRSYGSYLVGPHGVDRNDVMRLVSGTYYACFHYEYTFSAYNDGGLYISAHRVTNNGYRQHCGSRPYASSDWSARVRALFQPLIDEAQKNLI